MRTSNLLLVVVVAVLAIWVGRSAGTLSQLIHEYVRAYLLLRAGQGDGTTLILGASMWDQSPNTMNHSRFPANFWMYNGWTNNPVCVIHYIYI